MMKLFSSLLFLLLCLVAFSAARTNINWSTLTAEELAALDPSVFQRITKNDLYVIPPLACSGFKASQLQNFPASTPVNPVCQGFTMACYQNIPAQSFVGFIQTCVSYLPDDVFAATTAYQFEKLSTKAIA